MRKFRTENIPATTEHLKSAGFQVSDLREFNSEIMAYLEKNMVVKHFPNFTVEALIVDGEYIAGCQYAGENIRQITPAQFEQARHQIGL